MKKRIVALFLLVAAAAVPLFARQEKTPAADEKKEARTAYLRRMFATDRCTYGDGVRSIAGFVAGAPAEGEFAAIVESLQGQGIVPKDWNLAEASKLTKGTMAYFLCKALGIKGGATMFLTGTTRRYAFRECVFLGLMTGNSTDEFVSGRDLLDTMQRASIYKAEGSLDRIRR